MINGIQILTGYLTGMPNFYPGIQFEFDPKLTVFYGSNGCGKTSILKMLKAYCGIPLEKGGWSRISDVLALGANSKNHFPMVYREYSPGHSECRVAWDGTPTFFNEGDVKIDKWGWFTHKEILSEDGMSTEEEQMQLLIDNPSAGQYRLRKLNKLFNMAKNPPNLIDPPTPHIAHIAETEYIRSLPRTGRVTLLLDEPERALSVPKQMELFKLLEKMSDEYQIIVATHSPFVLFGTKCKLYNLQPGYDEECKKIFRECVKKIEETEQLDLGF